MKTQRSEQMNVAKRLETFGVQDRLHRTIGARIITFEVTVTELPETATAWCTLAPGYYYGVNIKATRNGEGYGALQPDHYFKTPAERDVAIDKYLVSARSRAQKREGR
jgi:hypothetical protein